MPLSCASSGTLSLTLATTHPRCGRLTPQHWAAKPTAGGIAEQFPRQQPTSAARVRSGSPDDLTFSALRLRRGALSGAAELAIVLFRNHPYCVRIGWQFHILSIRGDRFERLLLSEFLDLSIIESNECRISIAM